MKSPKKKAPAKRRTPSPAKPAPKASKTSKPPKATKPPKASEPAKASKPAKAPKSPPKKPAGAKKQKTVRDSFNMPADDYALIATLKKRALEAATQAKKSELLRAGLRLLTSLGDEAFKAALAALPAVKTGRPGKKKD